LIETDLIIIENLALNVYIASSISSENFFGNAKNRTLCSPPFLARLVSVIIWLSSTSDLSLVGGLSQNNHLQEIKELFFQEFSLTYYCYQYYQDTLSNLFSIAFFGDSPQVSHKKTIFGEKDFFIFFLPFFFSKKSHESKFSGCCCYHKSSRPDNCSEQKHFPEIPWVQDVPEETPLPGCNFEASLMDGKLS